MDQKRSNRSNTYKTQKLTCQITMNVLNMTVANQIVVSFYAGSLLPSREIHQFFLQSQLLLDFNSFASVVGFFFKMCSLKVPEKNNSKLEATESYQKFMTIKIRAREAERREKK